MSDGNGHVPPMNPYGGVGGGGITMPPVLQADRQRRQRVDLLPDVGGARQGRDANHLRRQLPVPAAEKPGGHLHYGRARQWQALLLRLRSRLPAQHPRDAGAAADGQRHLPHPPARRPLRRAALPLRLRPLGGPLEAAAGARSIGQNARGRHPGDGRRDEADGPLAHRQLQLLTDRRRLRGRGQRVRLSRRQRHLLRPGRGDDPSLAPLPHQGRGLRLPPRLERPLVRLDRRRATGRAHRRVREGTSTSSSPRSSPTWRSSRS